MAQNKHAAGTILKFDIEGVELQLLNNVAWTRLRFGLVLFEVHATRKDADLVPHSPTFSELRDAFGQLEKRLDIDALFQGSKALTPTTETTTRYYTTVTHSE